MLPLPYAPRTLRGAARVALAVVCLVALSACSGGSGSSATVSFAAGQRHAAPDLKGTTLRGNKPFSLSALKGQVVVVNYWASWCDPCREEAPYLDRTYTDFDGKGVEFIGVDYHGDGTDGSKALAFMKAHDVPYDSLFDRDSKTVLQFKGTVAIEAPPVTLVIDKRGRVADVINGVVVYDDLHKFITNALAEAA